MKPCDITPIADNDPTGEEEAIEFDGAQTIQLDDTYRVHVFIRRFRGPGFLG